MVLGLLHISISLFCPGSVPIFLTEGHKKQCDTIHNTEALVNVCVCVCIFVLFFFLLGCGR